MKVILLIIQFIFFTPFFLLSAENDEPSWVYKGRGDRYYNIGEVGKAIVEYKKALSPGKVYNGPGEKNVYPEVNLKLAEIYLSEGLYDLALMQITVAEEQKNYLQISDLIYNIWYVKAEIYFRMKRYSESVSVYEGIIKNDEN